MEFTIQHFIALAPLLITSLTIVVVMLAIAWRRNHSQTFLLSVRRSEPGLAVDPAGPESRASGGDTAAEVDDFALLYMALILVATLACVTLAHAYLGDGGTGYPGNREELYLLILMAAAGGLVLVSAQHLAGLFIGLELLSVPVLRSGGLRLLQQALPGSRHQVHGAVGGRFRVPVVRYGPALRRSRHPELHRYRPRPGRYQQPSPMAQLGLAMMLIGLAFKLSLVPFHLWTPDVYEGAPAPVAAFLATASKVAVFAVMVRLFQISPAASSGVLSNVLTVIAIASILFGNLLALTQNNLKRLLGYSSIAHFGYLLIALVASKGLAVEAIGVYLVTYVITSLGAFGVITLMSSPYKGRDADALYEYRGLFWRRPYLTAVLTVMMLSLAGIPLTAGFIGKFYIVATGVEAHQWWLVASLVLGSAIGVFYYLRVMVTLYLIEPNLRRVDAELHWEQKAGGVMLLAIALLAFFLGVYPQPLLTLVQHAVLGV